MLVQSSLIFLCFGIAAINTHPCAIITGGAIAPENAYPYQVNIRNGDKHICSGAIIDPRHILTSRYCIGSVLMEDLNLIVGTNSLKEGGTMYKVQEIILNDNMHNDIALIRTTENIIFDDKVNAISITNKDYRDDDTPILVTGWGTLLDGTLLTELLQELQVKLFNQEKCMNRYIDVDEGKFCTIEKCGTHLCHIDVGSPLVTDGVLIGIKSLGYNCGFDKADMHVRIYNYLDWIEDNIKIEVETTTEIPTTTTLPDTKECF